MVAGLYSIRFYVAACERSVVSEPRSHAERLLRVFLAPTLDVVDGERPLPRSQGAPAPLALGEPAAYVAATARAG